MPDSGKLWLRILNEEGQFLGQRVEVRLGPMGSTEKRVVHSDSKGEILMEVPKLVRAGYEIEIALENGDTLRHAVTLRAGCARRVEIRCPPHPIHPTLRLLGAAGGSSIEPGDSLDVEVVGLRPNQAYDLVVRDERGNLLFRNTSFSDPRGTVRRTSLWPQVGLDFGGESQVPIEQMVENLRGRRFSVGLLKGTLELARGQIGFGNAFTRPLIAATDAQGILRNAVAAGVDHAIVSALNVPFQGTARIFMVPRQRDWQVGDPFRPAKLASGRPALADVQVACNGRLRRQVAYAAELMPGAYDFIIRRIRYGYEDDEDMELRASDLVTRDITGLVVRGNLMTAKPVRGGCANTMSISGRKVVGRPYFEYADTFELGEDIYGALDPLVLDPNLIGKMVALYVIQHKTPAEWSSDPSLVHLPALGGNAAVQKLLTQSGCVNFNERLLWANASQVGEFDIVADFGNNTSDPSAFVPDGQFTMPTDICDGYFVAGFRVVTDPTTDTQFADAGSFTYNDSSVPIADDQGRSFTSNRQAIVYFPADGPGATTADQISNAQASYPLIIAVHGNSPDATSYLGYNYLLEHWAKNGFIAASIYCPSGSLATGRARLLFEHIAALRSRFGAHAQSAIGIMGHSRGGEAVVAALRLNHDEGLGHNFAGVICLAPSDWILHETVQPEWAAPLQVIYGSMDGDITGGPRDPDGPPGQMETGFAIYDRASGAVKSMVFIYGAIHDRFNTVWGDGDLGFGSLTASDIARVISADAHHQIAQGYMTAFFRRHLRGETQWDGIFTGEWRPAAVDKADGGSIKTYHQYCGSNRREIDSFEGAHNADSWKTSTIGGAVSDDGSLPATPQEDDLWTLDSTSPHFTAGMLFRWDNPTDRLLFDVPAGQRNVAGFSVLSFRIAQRTGSTSNTAGVGKDLYVTLKSGDGKSRSIRAAAFDEIPYPDQRGYSMYTKSAMRTVRIPLSSYTIAVINTDPVDLTNVESVSFDFGVQGAGEVEVDSVEFSN